MIIGQMYLSNAPLFKQIENLNPGGIFSEDEFLKRIPPGTSYYKVRSDPKAGCSLSRICLLEHVKQYEGEFKHLLGKFQ